MAQLRTYENSPHSRWIFYFWLFLEPVINLNLNSDPYRQTNWRPFLTSRNKSLKKFEKVVKTVKTNAGYYFPILFVFVFFRRLLAFVERDKNDQIRRIRLYRSRINDQVWRIRFKRPKHTNQKAISANM